MIYSWWRHRLDRADRRRVLLQNRRRHAELALPLERRLACHHLVQHRAQRENVAAPIQLLAFHLLWRHVLKRPNACPVRSAESSLPPRLVSRQPPVPSPSWPAQSPAPSPPSTSASREVLSRAQGSRLQGASGDGGDWTWPLVRAAAGGTGLRAVDWRSDEDQGQASAKAEDGSPGCRAAVAIAAGGSLSSGVGTQSGKSRSASTAVGIGIGWCRCE